MQDPNTENTLPIKSQPGDGETVPSQVNQTEPAPGAEPSIELTRPNLTSNVPVSAKPNRPRRWPWFLLGLFLVIVLTTAGGYLGYNAAIDLRKTKESEAKITAATERFILGMQAQENKNYDLARRYYEQVIQIDPNFPGVAEKLTEVIVSQLATATPTPLLPTVTPTAIQFTPTPDTRSQEEIYNQARQQYQAQEWDNVFLSIEALRNVDPSYRAVEVNGMLYTALRFRGIRKIYQESKLESGIYDLALAEKIAPLDDQAKGARNAAQAYLNAISFWGVDWPLVIQMLESVYPAMPNMRDPSGLTAIERYRQAVITQAAILAGQNDMCGAYDYYNKAISVAPDPGLDPTVTAVYLICYPPTNTPEPFTATPDPALFTPTPTPEVPTVAPPPVEQPTPEATLEPSPTTEGQP